MGGKSNGGFTKCLGYFLNGMTNCAEIHRLTGVHERTVRRYLKDYQNRKPVEEVGRIGRPPIVTAPGKVRIAQIVRHNPSISSDKIAEKVKSTTGNTISASTVRKKLTGMKYKAKKPRNVPALNAVRKQKRLDFALKYKDIDWSKVIFSDESFVQLFSNTLKLWTPKGVIRENPSVKDRTKVMFWGAFSQKERSELHFIEGRMTGQVYKGILEQHVVPLLKRLNKGSTSRRKGWMFQQDNDPKHTCKLVAAYIKENGLEVMEWPPYSPDLNPIENLWSIVKQKVYKRYPKNHNELKAFLVEEWKAIGQSTIDNLIASMVKRCELVIQNKGGRIPY